MSSAKWCPFCLGLNELSVTNNVSDSILINHDLYLIKCSGLLSALNIFPLKTDSKLKYQFTSLYFKAMKLQIKKGPMFENGFFHQQCDQTQ